ncbi:MAG: lytic transglycosylase domain-containing protein [Rickettsiales bacterium]|jgi:soluble lytic murein transglycosylase-like protein|nr:lytic transglycosylase domain-containing protein [Rickettsiales bacterium]
MPARLAFALAACLFLMLAAPVRADLPNVLYSSDIGNYKKIFELQTAGKIRDADKIIKEIKNDVLMGYVLHQRFMGPHYATKFPEIKDWLIKYSDMPNAGGIYKLGLKKGARKELRKPKREAHRTQYFNDEFSNSYQMIQSSYSHLAKKERNEVLYMIKIFNRRLRRGYTKNARQILENPHSKKYMTKGDYARMQAFLAFAYFLRGEDDMAILWADEPMREMNFYLANWALGLVYWRQGDYAKARDHFKNVAFTRQIPPDVVSAGAYWAWRANERIEDDEMKDDGEIFLYTAANFPKTFYGILANKKLGKTMDIAWDEPQLTLQNSRDIASWQGGIRALALIQLGMRNEAASELRFLIDTEGADASSDLISAVLAVAEIANMPQVSINVANYVQKYSESTTFASPHYPILDIDPEDGWRVDKALINALIRQESRFNPKAKSGSGARGLMQIMPSTASFIMRDSSFRKKQVQKLFNEEMNLKIGQMYIEYLLAQPEIDGNLFRFLVAYNAGPGNLKRQEKQMTNPGNDPLFFIEAVSLKETRIYIKRVMANFWIYRNRLRQSSESLDSLVENEWPIYVSKGDIQAARYTPQEMKYLEDLLEKQREQIYGTGSDEAPADEDEAEKSAGADETLEEENDAGV